MARPKSKKVQSKSIDSTEKQSAKTTSSSQGLGDTVEKVFKATGIDKVAKFVLGEDCGCEERKQTLNKLFPYRKPECLLEDEYQYLDEIFKAGRNTITPQQQDRLIMIYNRVFKDNAQPTSCGACFKSNVYSKLQRVYKEYK